MSVCCKQAPPLATPPKHVATETATFSTPSAQLFDTNPIYDDVHERALWSPINSSFSSDYCAFGGAGATQSHCFAFQRLGGSVSCILTEQ